MTADHTSGKQGDSLYSVTVTLKSVGVREKRTQYVYFLRFLLATKITHFLNVVKQKWVKRGVLIVTGHAADMGLWGAIRVK